MSTVSSAIVNPDTKNASNEALGQGQPARSVQHKNYRGFVAGIFSGLAKLSVGHPFDTIKVRLQTNTSFKGPLDCLLQTLRREGVPGLYKGATPPLLGWMFMDSIMLGSLTLYRRLLLENVFSNPVISSTARLANSKLDTMGNPEAIKLPAVGHGLAGSMAGLTVSFVASPFEHIKARLQIQYAVDKTARLYTGPFDCLAKIYRAHGIPGIYHGLWSTLLFRSFFFFWWSSYDVISRQIADRTNLSTPSINFLAGGLSAQVYWLTSYPADVVKQRIMTDPLGGKLNDGVRQFPRWKDAARAIWVRDGARGFWRGFVPCFLRAFPANAMALVAFESVMRALSE